MLGMERGSSKRATNALNCGANSAALMWVLVLELGPLSYKHFFPGCLPGSLLRPCALHGLHPDSTASAIAFGRPLLTPLGFLSSQV